MAPPPPPGKTSTTTTREDAADSRGDGRTVCLVQGRRSLTSHSLSLKGSPGNYNYDLSGSALRRLYNQPVVNAELMRRPLGGLSRTYGPLSHSGVRVTLGDGSQYLIHKGGGYGLWGGDTVVTDARHMSSAWEPRQSRDFGGSKTVADFVEAGRPNYNVLLDNCHDAANRMMNQ